MDLYTYAFQIVVSVIISYLLIYFANFLIAKLKTTSIRIFHPTEYFPKEQLDTLKQVHYLVLIFIILFSISNFFFDNGIIMTNGSEFYSFNAVLDILVSVYVATIIYKEKSLKSHILVLFCYLLHQLHI